MRRHRCRRSTKRKLWRDAHASAVARKPRTVRDLIEPLWYLGSSPMHPTTVEARQTYPAATEKASRAVSDATAERIRAAEAAVAKFQEQTEERLRAAEAATANLAAAQQRGIQSAERAGSTVMEGFARAQKQIADFVTERLRHDIDAQTALLRCRSLEDVHDVQQRFIKTAMDQYSAEATRMVKLSGDVASRALENAKG